MNSSLLDLYKTMTLSRLIEEHMILSIRKGHLSKWFSGIGQEAISVGASHALEKDEYILTLHRNLGVFISRSIPLLRLFRQLLGKPGGFTEGRDRTFHFGTNEFRIVGMISHLGAQLGVADGIALAHSLRNESKVVLVFTGEGGASEGDFHEAINVAAVWKLPVIFLIENNGYALSTPTSQQYICEQLSDRAVGYGIPGVTIDGNCVKTVHDTVKSWAERLRQNPHPVIIECKTFRMRGHEESSGTAYVPPEAFKEWAHLDPIQRAYTDLLDQQLFSAEENEEFRRLSARVIGEAFDEAIATSPVPIEQEEEVRSVYSIGRRGDTAPGGPRREMRLVDALQSGLDNALETWEDLVLMGQDIAEYGGVFKVTAGLAEKYSSSRVRNTPLCESAVLGAALGLSIKGMRSVVEMQFADFVTCGFNQVVNNLAKTHYRWGQEVNVTVRMPTGAGVRGGPFHSQSTEGWFMQVPGLKVVFPSNPFDAKGMLLAAIADPNPVLFFEHKFLYRSSKSEVPEGFYTVPLGSASVIRAGSDITIITYGLGVRWALDAVERHSTIDFEILDLRTLLPLDVESIEASVRKTGKVIVLTEPPCFAGPAAEILSTITERCFSWLDAPPVRLGSLFTPIPFAAEREDFYMATRLLDNEIIKLNAY